MVRLRSKRNARSPRRHVVEALEGRTLLVGYNFTWVGGAGDWADPAHWSSNAPANVTRPRPTSEDFVRIPASAGTVTAGNPQFNTATIDANLRLIPAASAYCYGNRFTMNGTLTLVGGGQYVTRLVFSTSATLDGSGNLAFESGGGQIGTQGAGILLTVGAGITIRPGGTFSGSITSYATTNVNGSILTFDGVKFTNRGVINLSAGELRFSSQSWTNLGTINISGGELDMSGTYRQSDLGSYTRTGGTVTLQGTLLGDLALNEHTGSWLGGGNLVGGRYTATGGATFAGNAYFDNYTLASDLTPVGGMAVRNNLTLDNAVLRLNGVGIRFDTAPLTNVRGSGRIEFSGGSFSQFVANQTLTIEEGVELRTANGNASLGGNNATQRLVINGSLMVTAQNQSLDLSTQRVDFNGALTVASGSNLFLGSGTTFNLGATGSFHIGERGRFDVRKAFNNAAAPGNVRIGGTTTYVGGTAAAPTTLEVAGQDRGPVPDGFRDNASMGVLRLNGVQTTRLIDSADNALGTGAQALYVDSLVVPNGGTLDLNGLKVYARVVQLTGANAIVGGTVTLLPDGGPIAWAVPTSGRIAVSGEKDEWTFFGSAGQTVSAVLNPSTAATSSSPAPVAPQIGLARLTLVSPAGVELGSVQTTAQGAFNTLPNITLPISGTYKLRVEAPLNATTRTGVYNLTLYDTTIQTRPLVLNTVTPGAIETPFSSDKWTFSLSAGQQVQFDLLASQTAGLQFTLEGPEGYVAFSNLTNDSTLITVPPGKSGNYVLSVRGQTDQTGAYSFIVRDGSITTLELGVPFSGTLPGSGSPRWFKTTLPNVGQLLLTLDDSTNTDRNQIYLRRGALPTRETFDYRYTTYAADEQIYVPNASPGDWYVLVYGDHVPAPSAYTLKAEYSDLRVTSITPDRYGVDNTMTMTLTGGGFEPGTVVKLVAGATALAASTVDVDSFTQITATFNLAGLPQGKFDVRVERGALSYTLPAAFSTVPNAPAKLDMKLVMPGFPTRVSARYFRVEYANSGNVAMPAPLIIVQSGDPQGDQRLVLTLDLDRMLETFWGSATPPGTSERVMMLGSGAVAGVLNPGERMSITGAYLGDKAPFETTDLTLELEMLCVEADGTQTTVAAEFESAAPPGQPVLYDSPRANWPAAAAQAEVNIDWDRLKEPLQPPSVPDAIWDDVYERITGPLGSVNAYADMLIANAQYLGRLGQRVVDIDELWNFEVQQALGTITAFPTLASSVDAQVPAPGEPLTFSRTFSDGVLARNTDGPFGFGWAIPWVARLSASANSDIVTIHGSGGGQRSFVRDSRGSSPLSPSATYISGTGDTSTLRRVSAGVYELRDTGGTVTRFRADGRIDFVQDANANRTTVGYDGAGRLVGLTHSSGGSIALEYNAAGRVSRLTDSLGHVVSYTYDASGDHLVSASGTDGSNVEYAYDASPNVMLRHALLSERAAGSTQFYTYDARGRVASSSLAGGVQRVNVSYDAGHITLADPAGSGSLYFDNRLRLAKVTNALGASSVTRYDADDRLASVTLADGSVQRYTWCDCGPLASFTNELGDAVTFTRDPKTRNVTSVKDPKGNVSRLTYNAAGDQLAQIYPDGTSEAAGNFTPTGLPQAFTNRAGQTSTYAYNAAGQVTRRAAADGVVTDYTYDSRGRLATARQGTQVTTFAYDTAVDGDRMKRATYPDGRFVEYDYDDAGRRIAIRDQGGFTTRYEYDAPGRLTHVRDGTGAALATYLYDAAGRLAREDHANGTYTTYTYDAAGQVLGIENWRSTGVLNSAFGYTYDVRGRRTSATTPEGTWSYGHDRAGQLVNATFASTTPSIPNQSIQITYDAAGNRTFMRVNGVLHDYATNALNQYTRVDGVNYIYDANGNLLSDGTRNYAYDDLSRLVQVTSGVDVQQFEYNVFGARDATVVNGQRTEFLVTPGAMGQVLAEYDGSGALLAHNIDAGYLVGRTPGGGAVNFFDTDATGSVAGLTGDDGAYVNRYAYDPFGQALLSVETVANPYEFGGGYGVRAAIGGLSQMGFRQYAASDGRFTSAEPLRTRGDFNAYRYATNSPVMRVDPTGLWGEGIIAKVLTKPGPSEANFFGGLVLGVGNDAWVSVATGAASNSSVGDQLWGQAVSFAFNAGFSLPGLNGFSNAFQLALNPEVNQNFVSAACGLAYQREFGTINKGAAKQLAALAAESGGAGGGTVNAACLDGFPGSGDADFGIGDRCGYGAVSLAPRPLDPNDKIPPVGIGPDNRVPIDRPVQYTVDFENLGPGSRDEQGRPYPVVASVPAQRVSIADQLSGNFDWSTVVFEEFRFGDTIVPVAEGNGSFHAVVPLQQNGVPFEVRIDADVDLSTGVLSVVFQALDPVTGLPPAPMIGVVAPEDGGGRGMGYFKFSVKARPDVPDGTQVRNIALIQFDQNEVIATNQINPLDASAGTDPAREALITLWNGSAFVAGRSVFYNHSALDGNDAAAGPADDRAIAADKRALLPGQSASFQHVTTYSRGVNGVMIDMAGLARDASLTASDFVIETRNGTVWSSGPAPQVSIRAGAGASGTDRLTLIFPDFSVRNTWLKVTVRANERTGLASPDVFYFGNLVGDTGGPGAPAVNVTDLKRTRAFSGTRTAAAIALYDFDRDGVVNATDYLIARGNQGRGIILLTAPSEAPLSQGNLGAAPARPVTRPTRRDHLSGIFPVLLG